MDSILHYQQIASTLSMLMLFAAFALLINKRILSLINSFAIQSFLLALATFGQAFILHRYAIYFSALLTLTLKVILIPWFLRRLIFKLKIPKEIPQITHPFFTLFGALALVIFCYYIIAPINLFPSIAAKNIVVVAMTIILLGMLLMIIRSNAISHVIGFMVMENGLFFAALISTQGVPMIVELGVAFDLLVAVVLFGVFFFHIRSSIDSMDVDSLNRLREDTE
ncbi:MAG: formate hydrogenlyase [Gammaproteobacteria bacterium]|nr:formate hydrogenlyase [Gammaproteobacteria bacterium]